MCIAWRKLSLKPWCRWPNPTVYVASGLAIAVRPNLVSGSRQKPQFQALHGAQGTVYKTMRQSWSTCIQTAMRKPKTNRRKRKPKPKIIGMKGCRPSAQERFKIQPPATCNLRKKLNTWQWTLFSLVWPCFPWSGPRMRPGAWTTESQSFIPPRVQNMRGSVKKSIPHFEILRETPKPFDTTDTVDTGALHNVSPRTTCKVHLALRAPMPWKAWSSGSASCLAKWPDLGLISKDRPALTRLSLESILKRGQ